MSFCTVQGPTKWRVPRRRLPSEISLQDLLQAGYLTTNDVRAFERIEVTL